MSNKKNLTMDSLKEKNKKYEEFITIEVNDEWDLEVKKEWSPIDISSLVGEFTSQVREMIGTIGLEEILPHYLYILIMKYFTKFGDAIPDDFNSQIKLIQELIDDGVYGDIMNCFPEDQMEKVESSLENLTEYINQQVDKYDEELKELDIENKEVRDNLVQ